MNGFSVVIKVTQRIGGGGRRFTQHIIRIGEALGLRCSAIFQRLFNGLPGDELLTHHLHGKVHPAPDHRLPSPGNQPSQRRAKAYIIDTRR